jgi:putative hydrolase of the HAD superfamily
MLDTPHVRPPRLWVFDLDNTLHDARPHVFPHINRSMTDYIRQHLRLDEAGAQALRLHYWRTYGATLKGLMHHHQIDARHFLQQTHCFDDLSRMLLPEPGLRHTLTRLPGRRVVLTNGPLHYAENALQLMGVAGLFSAVYGVEHSGFRPKPDIAALHAVLKAERVAPQRVVLVEDTLANLRPARRLGMRTVWISRSLRYPRWLDLRLPMLRGLPRAAAALGWLASKRSHDVPGRGETP